MFMKHPALTPRRSPWAVCGVVFDPTTLMIASTAVSTVGSLASGAAQAQSAQAQAQAAAYNAAVQRAQAEQERMAGQMEAQDRRDQGEKQLGALRARVGGSGVDMTGTPLLVAGALDKETETNVSRTLYGSSLRARSLESGAKLNDMAMNNHNDAASSAYSNAFIGAGTSLLGGVSKMAKEGGWKW